MYIQINLETSFALYGRERESVGGAKYTRNISWMREGLENIVGNRKQGNGTGEWLILCQSESYNNDKQSAYCRECKAIQ